MRSSSTIIKSEAVALRLIPYSNTSHVVIWLTGEHGKVTTLVKGACRPKSAFLGQYDTAAICEILFYARERNGLHILKECSPLAAHGRALRTDYRLALTAAYACHLADHASHPFHADEPTYARLTEFIERITTAPVELQLLLHWFELKLLHIHGVAPSLNRCVKCRAVPPRVQTQALSAELGGIVCSRCRPGRGGLDLIGADSLSLLETLARIDECGRLSRIRTTPNQRFQISTALGRLLAYHMDVAPSSRRVALQLLVQS